MAYASTLRGAIAAPAAPSFGFGFMRSIAEVIVDSQRRKAIRELRRHQAFGPLISIKHIGLTRDELLPF
jgi:hypothetical protein